ncbi:MAG: DUF4105 domain-containing protein [Paramuribaculum sp.]|nr:DUF4105 domain-containing protein [Paramuribaculum sp.]
MIRALISLIVAFVTVFSVQAQQSACDVDSSGIDIPRLSLLTCSPGADIYELEGHTGLRIYSPETDVVVHWGLFDFSAPNFVYRFVKGETDYRIGMVPTSHFLNSYAEAGRYVTEQVLDLSDEEVLRAINLIEENLLPQNRVYRYNYVKDNCATRPVHVIERAVGDSIEFVSVPAELGDDYSFRSIMKHYHQGYPWYQFGIDIALGADIDYPLAEREVMFAPVALSAMLDDAVFAHSGRKVVAESHVIAGTAGSDVREAPTPWYLTPLAAGCYLLALCVVIAYISVSRMVIIKWFYALFYLVIGLVGCIVAFLVFISVHEATTVNWQILWLNPLALAVPLLVWSRRCRGVLRVYFIINIAAVMAFVVGVFCGAQGVSSAFVPYLLSDMLLSVVYMIMLRHDRKSK